MKKKIEIKTYEMGESIFAAIIFLVFGIFLITDPEKMLKIVLIVFGGCLTLLGVFKLLLYYKTTDGNKKDILSGGMFIILGMAIILWVAISFENVVKFLSITFAIYLFYVGINRVVQAFKVKGSKKPYFINALVIVLIAVLLVALSLWIDSLVMVGILITLYAIVEIVGFILGRNNFTESKKVAEAVVIKEQIDTKSEDVKLLK